MVWCRIGKIRAAYLLLKIREARQKYRGGLLVSWAYCISLALSLATDLNVSPPPYLLHLCLRLRRANPFTFYLSIPRSLSLPLNTTLKSY